MNKIIPFILLILFVLTSSKAQDVSRDLIKEDLEYLRKELPAVHKNAFHTISEKEFNSKINALIENVEDQNIFEIYTGVMNIIASIGDGHTWIDWWANPTSQHYYPVRFEEFSDGVYLTYTIKEYESILGKKLVAIEGVELEKAMDTFLSVTPGDNVYDQRRRIFRNYLSRSTIAYGLGITPSLDKMRLTLEDASGNQIEKTIMSLESQRNPFLFSFIPNHPDLVSARDLTNPPLFLRNPNENFWIEYLSGFKTLYVRFWTVLNDQKKGKDIDDLAQEMRDLIKEKDARKLIIDVRYNGGGNNQLTMNLLHEVIKAEKVNQQGRLFLLINDFTFSAAGHFTTYIEQHTNSTLVGTPSAFSPNHYGDNRPLQLPNTGWNIRASALFWQNSLPWDDRKFTEPDYYIEPSFSDYANNRDPVLEYVLNLDPSQGSLLSNIQQAVESKDKKKASRLYAQINTEPRYRYQDLESQINQLGYRLLGSGKIEEAIIAFEINVEQNPESANVYDSMADAYLANGQKELAIEYSKKALELNPSQNVRQSAESKLRKLIKSGQ